MFILYQTENNQNLFISGKFEIGEGKRKRINPDFSTDELKAIKFEDEVDVYEYFDSETRGNQILKTYQKKEI